MDTLSECTCAFVGCSYEDVLELAPCPPPSFYSEFAGYAIDELALCSTEICKIAVRCLTNFPTNDSSQIIQSICNPTPPTTPTTTPITIPTTTSTTTPTTPSSSTSIPATITSTGTPVRIETPAQASGSIALIVTLVLVAFVLVIVVILVVKYKRSGNFQISKWTWFSFIRRNTDRKDLILRKKKKTKVCFDNPNYSVCIETIESEEIQERSRKSTAEVELHIKRKDEEIFLDAIITDEVKSGNLVERKAVEKEKKKELVDTLASSMLTCKETGIGEEMLEDIGEIRIDPTNMTVVFEEHERFKTNNNEAINSQTKPSDKSELKENIQHCDGDDFTETIKEKVETKDSKTNGTATEISDETRDSPTGGRASDKVADHENTSDMTRKIRESVAEISATDGVKEEQEANDSEIHCSPETSDEEKVKEQK